LCAQQVSGISAPVHLCLGTITPAHTHVSGARARHQQGCSARASTGLGPDINRAAVHVRGFAWAPSHQAWCQNTCAPAPAPEAPAHRPWCQNTGSTCRAHLVRHASNLGKGLPCIFLMRTAGFLMPWGQHIYIHMLYMCIYMLYMYICICYIHAGHHGVSHRECAKLGRLASMTDTAHTPQAWAGQC